MCVCGGGKVDSKMMMTWYWWIKHVPYCFLHCSKKGKRTAAQLWETGGSVVGAFTVVDWAFFISLIFPSSKLGTGPLMPCFLSVDRSLLGFTTNELYNRTNNPKKPSNAKEMNIFASNCSSMVSFLLLMHTATQYVYIQNAKGTCIYIISVVMDNFVITKTDSEINR